MFTAAESRQKRVNRLLGRLGFTNVHIGGEMVDSGQGCRKPAGGLVHSRPPEEGSFSWRLQAQRQLAVSS